MAVPPVALRMPLTSAARPAAVSSLMPNDGLFVIAAFVVLRSVMVAADAMPVPVVTHLAATGGVAFGAVGDDGDEPSVTFLMSTAGKLQGQPAVVQPVVTSGAPASGGASGFAMVVAGFTTAIATFVKSGSRPLPPGKPLRPRR